ncbi:MAG: P1 family peptidase [Chloroflexota bacterium]
MLISHMSRRLVLVPLAVMLAFAAVPPALAQSTPASSAKRSITDIPGIKVGHFQDLQALKGTTVILTEDGAEAGVDVRGSAPGTRETDLLRPENLVQQVNAIVLSGGSAYGLDSAQGVMRYLEERGKGFQVGPNQVVPIVPAAILFDLGVGSFTTRPTADWGYQAAVAATDGPVVQGNVGAGTGATVGKTRAGVPMKGGLGTASLDIGGGVLVGAIVAVNGVGDVVNPRTGHFYAESFIGAPLPAISPTTTAADDGGLLSQGGDEVTNTTIAVVATNARLTKTQMNKVASMAHDGLARAIRPVHTLSDGDTVFAVSAGGDARVAYNDVSAVGAGAADALTQAIVNAILNADSIPGFPSYKDLSSAAK